MSTGGGGLQGEINQVIDLLDGLKVNELKFVCKTIKLPVTGRKLILQDRIKAFLKNSLAIGHIDPWRPKTIREIINLAQEDDSELPDYEVLWTAYKTGKRNDHTNAQPNPRVQQMAPNNSYQSNTKKTPANIANTRTKQTIILHFKESPFYKVLKLIPDSIGKIKKAAGRGVCTTSFRFTEDDWKLLMSNKSKFKLYLFCGMLNASGNRAHEPIQFPHPNEIKFNNIQIKDNVRGLKSKPGTAKPADLTMHMYPPSQMNVLEIVHAFTANEFAVYCYIIQSITPEELLKSVLHHPKILKIATLHYIKSTLNDEEDEDLITTSTVMSLQCPISYTKMVYPAKGINCKHLQCFDALWFLHSQNQVPTWQCPVCQLPLKIDTIAICEFVDEILKSTTEEIEQVELSADGVWIPLNEDGEQVPTARINNANKQSIESAEFQVKSEDSSIQLPKEDSTSSTAKSTQQHSEQMVISLDSEDEDDMVLANHTPIGTNPENDLTSNQSHYDHINASKATSIPSQRSGMTATNTNNDNIIQNGLTLNNQSKTASNSSNETTATAISDNITLSNFNIGETNNSLLGVGESRTDNVPNHSTGNINGVHTQSENNSSESVLVRNNNPITSTNTTAPHNPTDNRSVANPSPAPTILYQENTDFGGVVENISNNSINNEDHVGTAEGNILGISGNFDKFIVHNNTFNAPSNTIGNDIQSQTNVVPLNSLPYSETHLLSKPGIPSQTTNTVGSHYPSQEAILARQVPHNLTGRQRRSNVSPFIPKKPYLNKLPQKRHMTNDARLRQTGIPPNAASVQHINGSMQAVGSNVAAIHNSFNNGTSTHDNLDVIDLTSD